MQVFEQVSNRLQQLYGDDLEVKVEEKNLQSLRKFSLGQDISQRHSANEDFAVLLVGKVRMLQQAGNNSSEKTVFWLSPGDIIPMRQVKRQRIRPIASEEEIALLYIPKGIINKIPPMQASLSKIETMLAKYNSQQQQTISDFAKAAATSPAPLSQHLQTAKENTSSKKNTSSVDIFGWYCDFFMRHGFLTAQIILSALFVQLFSLGMPMFNMIIFDRVFGKQNESTLWVMTIGMVIIFLFDLAVRSVRSAILTHQIELVDRANMRDLCRNVFNLPLEKINGELLKNYARSFGEVMKAHTSMCMMIFIHALDAAFSIIPLVILLWVDVKFALISIATIIPITLLAFFLNPSIRRKAMDTAQAQRKTQGQLLEALEGAETIQSLNLTQYLHKNILKDLDSNLDKSIDSNFGQINEGNLSHLISSLGSTLTLFVGAYEVLQGNIGFGEYLLVSMLSRVVLNNLQRFVSALARFHESSDTLKEARKLSDSENIQKEDMQDKKLEQEHLRGEINIVNLCFGYEDKSVLQSINLQIYPGQKIILAGKSGSGKTTLIRLLQRLYTPGSGYITFDGYNAADFALDNLRQRVAVALQRPKIFSGTIRHNISLAKPDASLQEISDVAAMVGLDQFIMSLPEGFDTELVAMGRNLASSQLALICLARVLLLNPSILIMDKALAAVDKNLISGIFSRVWERYKERTCIFVTENILTHKSADRILVLNDGKLVEDGTYQDLINQKGYYFHLHSQ